MLNIRYLYISGVGRRLVVASQIKKNKIFASRSRNFNFFYCWPKNKLQALHVQGNRSVPTRTIPIRSNPRTAYRPRVRDTGNSDILVAVCQILVHFKPFAKFLFCHFITYIKPGMGICYRRLDILIEWLTFIYKLNNTER